MSQITDKIFQLSTNAEYRNDLQNKLIEISRCLTLATNGHQVLLWDQLSMESPPGEAHSPCPLRKALPLLLCKPEAVFRIF